MYTKEKTLYNTPPPLKIRKILKENIKKKPCGAENFEKFVVELGGFLDLRKKFRKKKGTSLLFFSKIARSAKFFFYVFLLLIKKNPCDFGI